MSRKQQNFDRIEKDDSDNENMEETVDPMSVEERQKCLLDYGFKCRCNLCTKEMNGTF